MSRDLNDGVRDDEITDEPVVEAPGWLYDAARTATGKPKGMPAPSQSAPRPGAADGEIRAESGTTGAPMMKDMEASQARALELLFADGPDAVLSEPWALAALADPGQWAGDVERMLATLPAATRQAIRRAGKAVLKAGRAEAGMVVPFPGTTPPPKPHAALEQPLLLSARGGCWVRVFGRYVSVEQSIAVYVLLQHGTQITIPTQQGERLATWPEAYSRVGAVVSKIVYQLGVDVDRYDHTDRTLYIGCGTPDPALEPKFHPEVDAWLDALAGEGRAYRLRDWIAASWRLQEPTAALYLQGSASTGKSMFAQALQRCYGTSIATYADVILGNYSGQIVNQPIVWLDERAPEDRNNKGTAAFRTWIANRSHSFTQKFQPSGTILGCPRLVITANNDDALRFGREDLTREDLEAIAIRILHVEVRVEAAAYLSSVDTTGWVEGPGGTPGKVCEHFAWLRDHHDWTVDGPRLLVEGEVGHWLRRQSSQAGLAQEVLVAVVRALTDLFDAKDPDSGEYVARRVGTAESGHVLVSATDLHRAWPLLTGDRSGRVTVAKIGRTLKGLSGHGERRTGTERRHPVPNALLVDAAALFAHAGILDDKLVPKPA